MGLTKLERPTKRPKRGGNLLKPQTTTQILRCLTLESKGAFRAREQRDDTRPLREVVPGVLVAGDAIEDNVG